MPATTFIYALCEPNSRTVRYIGKANNPAYRFKQHLRRSVKAKTHLGNWLRLLASRGETPALAVLREIPDEQREIAEERYIRLARGLGIELVNSTDGGDGCHNPTPETRVKIGSANRGKVFSEARKNKMAAASPRGEHHHTFNAPMPESVRQKISVSLTGDKNPAYGVERPPEVREKISRGLLGKKKSEAHCESLRVAWARRKAAKA